mmetsp:Transcript_6281/g.9128  ORF Transcript_6281/g.9128 Transcript_6281/m.9128 type:complete len:170 (+) Transcript_6281:15-524(+)
MNTTENNNSIKESPVPKAAIAAHELINSCGIQEYDPKLIQQVLEYMNTYASNLLEDAQVYHMHSEQDRDLNLDDVKLAISTREQHQYTEVPSTDNLVKLARSKNKFNISIEKNAVMLPPARLCVSSNNYRIALNTAKRQRILAPQSSEYQKAANTMKQSDTMNDDEDAA